MASKGKIQGRLKVCILYLECLFPLHGCQSLPPGRRVAPVTATAAAEAVYDAAAAVVEAAAGQADAGADCHGQH